MSPNDALLVEAAKRGLLPAQSPAASDTLAGTTNAAANAFTFGLVDQARALGRATGYELKSTFGAAPPKSFGQAYRDALTQIHGEENTFAKAHPALNVAGTVAGTAGAIGPFVGLKTAATLGGKVLQGATTGGIVGGVAGAAGSDLSNPTRAAVNTGLGAVGGAVTGGALPPIAAGAGRLAAPIAERVGLLSPETTATRAIAARVAQDAAAGGPGPREIGTALGTTPGMAVADVAGRNVKALGGSTFRAGGPGSQFIEKALNDRDARAGTVLSDAIDQGIAKGPSNFTTVRALQEQAAKDAAPLYQEAFAANKSIDSPKLNRILKTPFGQSALAAARERMANKMTLMGTPDPELTQAMREASEVGRMDAVPGGVAKGMKLQTWDQIKQAMDQEIAALRRRVIAGTAKRGELADAVSLKNALVRELDKLDVTARAGPRSTKIEGGAYARARAAFAGPSAMQDALEEGSQIFTKHPDEIAADIAGLSPSERKSYLLGAANALKDRIAKVPDSANEANKVVGNEMLRRQLRPLFATQAGYDKFVQTARDVAQQFQTRSRTMLGSQTAERVAEDARGNGAIGDLVRGGAALAEGAPVAASLSLARAAGKGLIGPIMQRSPEANMAIARLLYSPDPQVQRNLLFALMQPRPNVLGAVNAPLLPVPGKVAGAVTGGLLGQQR